MVIHADALRGASGSQRNRRMQERVDHVWALAAAALTAAVQERACRQGRDVTRADIDGVVTAVLAS